MALLSGTRQAVVMAAGWVVVAGSAAVSLLYFSEIKAAARDVLGISAPNAVATADRYRSDRGPPRRVQTISHGRTVEIRAGSHGHYFAGVEINGRRIDVLIDSGASIVALTWDDAERAGVYVRDADFTQRVSTANGTARVAPVMLDRVSIGDITVRNVPAAVSEPGKLGTSLLGMSFLGRLQQIDIRSGVLVLRE
jgi:aspartyl protease family protein